MQSRPTDNSVMEDPETGFTLQPMTPAQRGDVARVLAAATGANTPEAGEAAIALAEAGGTDRVIVGTIDGAVIGAYTLVRDGFANELKHIAVIPEQRTRGFGRVMIYDALRRCGRRPLTVETDDDALGFYKAVGFKMVGRRKHPSGAFRYRLGWHAPSATPSGDNC